MSDYTDMLGKVASVRGLVSLTTTTRPTTAEALAFINLGTLDLARMLCPRRRRTGEWTEGRLDKLTKLYVTETLAATYAASNPATRVLPTANLISYRPGIYVGTGLVPAKEVDPVEVFVRSQGDYAATNDSPLYAFVDGKLYIASAHTANFNVYFCYLKKPADMAAGQTDFNLDDDLMPVVLDYALGCVEGMYDDSESEDNSMKYFERYFKAVQTLLGE